MPCRHTVGGLLSSSYRQHQESLAAERERRRQEREERLQRIEREERNRFRSVRCHVSNCTTKMSTVCTRKLKKALTKLTWTSFHIESRQNNKYEGNKKTHFLSVSVEITWTKGKKPDKPERKGEFIYLFIIILLQTRGYQKREVSSWLIVIYSCQGPFMSIPYGDTLYYSMLTGQVCNSGFVMEMMWLSPWCHSNVCLHNFLLENFKAAYIVKMKLKK